jgi:hypothetical protein
MIEVELDAKRRSQALLQATSAVGSSPYLNRLFRGKRLLSGLLVGRLCQPYDGAQSSLERSHRSLRSPQTDTKAK